MRWASSIKTKACLPINCLSASVFTFARSDCTVGSSLFRNKTSFSDISSRSSVVLPTCLGPKTISALCPTILFCNSFKRLRCIIFFCTKIPNSQHLIAKYHVFLRLQSQYIMFYCDYRLLKDKKINKKTPPKWGFEFIPKNMNVYFFLPKRLRKMRTNGKDFSRKRCNLDFFFLGLSK